MNLKHALVAALVVGLAAPLAQADLLPGDAISIVGSSDNMFLWGTPSYFALDMFPVLVESRELMPPAGNKFAAEIRIDYENVYLDIFPFEHIDLFGLREPGGENFINTVGSPDDLGNPFGLATTEGFSISFDAATADPLGGGGGVVFTTQGPAPGTLALLGAAGLMGRRRRRK